VVINFSSGKKYFGETWRRLESKIKCFLQQQGVKVRAVSIAVSTYVNIYFSGKDLPEN
jgi:hypothetical protein